MQTPFTTEAVIPVVFVLLLMMFAIFAAVVILFLRGLFVSMD